MRPLTILSATAATVAMMLGAGGQALADVTVYSTGFEAPYYTAGEALAGQQGWTGSLGVVENTFAYAGTQAVEFNSVGVTKAEGNVGDLTMLSVSSDGTLMQVSDEFYVTAADSKVAWTAISLGGNGGADSGFIGALYVADGDAILGNAVTGTAGTPITVGAWNSYTIDIDFATETETGYVNGIEIGSLSNVSGGTELTEVGFGIDGANGGTSQAYADNLSVDTVPEPATLLLFAPALLALGFYHRRQRRVPTAA